MVLVEGDLHKVAACFFISLQLKLMLILLDLFWLEFLDPIRLLKSVIDEHIYMSVSVLKIDY